MVTRRLVILLVALLASVASAAPATPLPATGTFVGTVTDAKTGEPLVAATVSIPALRTSVSTDLDGRYQLRNLPVGPHTLRVTSVGYDAKEVRVEVRDGATTTVDVALVGAVMEEIVGIQGRITSQDVAASSRQVRGINGNVPAPPPTPRTALSSVAYLPLRAGDGRYAPPVDREGYAPVDEVGFKRALDAPLSTFSIDVDRASYANARRFLQDGQLPPRDAVRVEEFVNSFDYALDGPSERSRHPFAVHTEMTVAPWAPEHRLVRIGLQGRRIDTEDLPPANLVFLIDVSGSMQAPDKLPLLQRAFQLLVREMRPQDRVALVVYAGASGLVLPPTDGTDKARILGAIDDLRAGGSTAGAEGLRLAYATARQHFDPRATNRVILATDGDFNVGLSSDAEMQRLVEEERESGVFLSVLGFGTGNLQDSKMETLADRGNGNYAYIDSIREAERVFVREFGGTLFAIAKDVKIQVEFNPAHVAGYRLIGYENRVLANEDFNDDRKDAGELGAGHTVTALYEVVPAGVDVPGADVDDLRFQRPMERTEASNSDDWLWVKLRYKPALDAGTFADGSVLLETGVGGAPVSLDRASEATRWAVAVTEAALLLRQSEFAPGASYDHALALARGARGRDAHGDRAEFIRLIETAAALTATERDEYEVSLPD